MDLSVFSWTSVLSVYIFFRWLRRSCRTFPSFLRPILLLWRISCPRLAHGLFILFVRVMYIAAGLWCLSSYLFFVCLPKGLRVRLRVLFAMLSMVGHELTGTLFYHVVVVLPLFILPHLCSFAVLSTCNRGLCIHGRGIRRVDPEVFLRPNFHWVLKGGGGRMVGVLFLDGVASRRWFGRWWLLSWVELSMGLYWKDC